VFLPSKELRFFSGRYQWGEAWYSRWFDERSEKAIGEKSPSYLVNPEAPERIHQWNPDVKLIFCFRDPIQRAYSHYCMALKSGNVSEDVDAEIRPGTRFVEFGRFFHHLSRYRELFPSSNIKCMIFDDLKEDPEAIFADVCEFIDVDPSFRPSILDQRFGQRKPRPRFQKLWDTLLSVSFWISNNSHLGERFIEYVRKKNLMRWFHLLNEGRAKYPEMSEVKRRELANFYEQDVADLSSYLDRDLSDWLKQRPR